MLQHLKSLCRVVTAFQHQGLKLSKSYQIFTLPLSRQLHGSPPDFPSTRSRYRGNNILLNTYSRHYLPCEHYCTSIPTTNQENMADNKYSCDYAKRGTSSCKKCKQKLEKGGLRVAKVVANFFSDGEGEMKQYHHAKCIFETFVKARATTKIIEVSDDLEGYQDLEQSDKDMVQDLIKETMEKKGSKKGTPKKKPAKQTTTSDSPTKKVTTPSKPAATAATSTVPGPSAASSTADFDPSVLAEKDNSFREYRRLCAEIAEVSSYNDKTSIVVKFLKKGSSGDGFKGDIYLLMKLLLPGVVKTVYNINSKQLVKVFSQIFGTNLAAMVEDLEQGDVAETVKENFEKSTRCPPTKKSTLTIQEVNAMLTELSQFTKEDDQQRVLTKIAKSCTANDLKMVVRLIKHDLRINAGAKHILDGLDPNAYNAFQASRDLKDVVDRVAEIKKESNGKPGMSKKLSIRANLMTPVLPMLAEACKSVEHAFKKCPNGMYAEIKYDGERVQVHKQGDKFNYFSRSLKPVLPHKVSHFKDYIPKAFSHAKDLILDAEVLLIDTTTSKPLPFGTLGVHKKAAFQDANVCLFIFDCLHFNGENLMDKPIKERRKFLHDNMTEVPNRILFSEMTHIKKTQDLRDLMMKVFREGLEGLVLKDLGGVYEPGKRHWLKVKKDYLAEGAMADSADLVVLGAYFGTGNKGGIMSVFLMGTYDAKTDMWRTVTKCHSGFDDKTLEKLQKELDMEKISKDYTKIPSWLRINKGLTPDFIAKDPKKSPVWEITGAEFTKSESHTADGISIRFPRCTKMRDDKTWETATDLDRLKLLYKKSKEYSDIPNVIGASTKAKQKDSDDENGSTSDIKVKMETEDSNGSSNGVETPKKRKKDEDEADGTPVKKVKQEGKSPCKYGASCYQSSPSHKETFSHPNEKPSGSNSTLPEIFKGMKFYLPESLEDYKKLKRYIIAFDGDVVAEFDKSSATHIVSAGDESSGASDKIIAAEWLRKCIKKKKLVPYSS